MNDLTIDVKITREDLLDLASTCVDVLIASNLESVFDEVLELAGISESEIIESLASWDVFQKDVICLIRREAPFILSDEVERVSSFLSDDGVSFTDHKEWRDLCACLNFIDSILEDVAYSDSNDSTEIQKAISLLSKNNYRVTKIVREL